MTWCIYYDDGSKFTDRDGAPSEAPSDGIQAISERLPNNRIEIHHKREYYWWAGDCWASGDQSDLDRWLRKLVPELKFGRYTSWAVYQQAMEDASGGSI